MELNRDFSWRPLVECDAVSLSALMRVNTSIFNRFFPKTCAQNNDTTASLAFIRRKHKEAQERIEYTYAIVGKSGLVAGLLILKEVDWESGKAELCYCLGKSYQGKGWVRKSVGSIAKHALTDLGLQKLYAIIYQDNKGSLNVVNSNGFVWKQTLKEEYTPPGEPPLDMELFELDLKKLLELNG